MWVDEYDVVQSIKKSKSIKMNSLDTLLEVFQNLNYRTYPYNYIYNISTQIQF